MKNIFKTIVLLATVMAFFCGCDVIAEIWKEIQLNAAQYNTDFVVKNTVESATSSSEINSLAEAKKLKDLSFLGLSYDASKVIEVPIFDETNKTIDTKYGLPVSDVLTNAALTTLINDDKAQSISIADQCKLANKAASDLDIRKLFSYGFYPKMQITKENEKEALSWETITKKSSYKDFSSNTTKEMPSNGYIYLGVKKMFTSFIDAIPSDKEDISTVSLNRKNVRSFGENEGEDAIFLYRSLKVNDENVLVKRYVSQDFEWETADGDILKSKAIWAKWLFGISASVSEIEWEDAFGKKYTTDLDSTYFITSLDSTADKQVCIGFVVEKNKLGRVKVICAAPVSVTSIE